MMLRCGQVYALFGDRSEIVIEPGEREPRVGDRVHFSPDTNARYFRVGCAEVVRVAPLSSIGLVVEFELPVAQAVNCIAALDHLFVADPSPSWSPYP